MSAMGWRDRSSEPHNAAVTQRSVVTCRPAAPDYASFLAEMLREAVTGTPSVTCRWLRSWPSLAWRTT